MTSSLLEPFRFANGVTAPNRIWLAPMTNLQSHADGSLGEAEYTWLMRRATGGFGVIETCAAHVADDGRSWQGQLGVQSNALLPGLTRLAEGLRAAGSFGVVQLFHGGVRVDPKLNGRAAWSASAVEEDGVTPHAASEAEIARVIGDFRAAAVRAQTAGFQGVELHGAHGYLFGQFLSTWNNRRTDAWGGALENRARLLVQTLREIRSAVRPDFVVGVRLSPENWGHAKGLDLDESLQVARWLAEAGLDYLHLSLWKASAPTKKRPDQHPVTLFKRELQGRVPIVVAGQIWTREEAESVVALGASGVALGLAAIANPEWPKGIRASAWQPDRPPFSAQQLLERGLSPAFADNMALWWPDFVIRS